MEYQWSFWIVYVGLPEGETPWNPSKNHHFPMVFLWFTKFSIAILRIAILWRRTPAWPHPSLHPGGWDGKLWNCGCHQVDRHVYVYKYTTGYIYIYIHTYMFIYIRTCLYTCNIDRYRYVCMDGYIYIYWLVVSNPPKNMSSSIGMMTFPICRKIKNVPNHQPVYLYIYIHTYLYYHTYTRNMCIYTYVHVYIHVT